MSWENKFHKRGEQIHKLITNYLKENPTETVGDTLIVFAHLEAIGGQVRLLNETKAKKGPKEDRKDYLKTIQSIYDYAHNTWQTQLRKEPHDQNQTSQNI